MKKLTTTLVCAFAVLAFSAGATAQDDEAERACGEVEKGTWTFDSEAEMNEFLEELAAEAAENCTSEDLEEDELLLDLCFTVGPIAHAVTTVRWQGEGSETWTTTTDIESSGGGYFTISVGGLPDPEMFEDVNQLRVTWRHPGGLACNYCTAEDPTWQTDHWYSSSFPADDYKSCSSLYGVYYYFGREWNDYNNYGFSYNLAKFESDPGYGAVSYIILEI